MEFGSNLPSFQPNDLKLKANTACGERCMWNVCNIYNSTEQKMWRKKGKIFFS